MYLFMNGAFWASLSVHLQCLCRIYRESRFTSRCWRHCQVRLVTQLFPSIANTLLRCRPWSHCVESYRVDNVLGASIYSVALETNLTQIVARRRVVSCTSQWRHNGRDSVSNHQPHDYLLNRLFRRRLKKTSKLRVIGLCVGNSPGTVNSPHKWPVTRKMFPFDHVIMKPHDLAIRVMIFKHTSIYHPGD